MKMMDKGGPFVAVVLGLALVNYALVAGAMSDILKARLSVADGLAAIAVFTVLALSTEWGPYVAFVVDRPRSEQFMGRVRTALIAHNRVILIWVFTAMGVLYVAKGLDSAPHRLTRAGPTKGSVGLAGVLRSGSGPALWGFLL